MSRRFPFQIAESPPVQRSPTTCACGTAAATTRLSRTSSAVASLLMWHRSQGQRCLDTWACLSVRVSWPLYRTNETTSYATTAFLVAFASFPDGVYCFLRTRHSRTPLVTATPAAKPPPRPRRSPTTCIMRCLLPLIRLWYTKQLADASDVFRGQ